MDKRDELLQAIFEVADEVKVMAAQLASAAHNDETGGANPDELELVLAAARRAKAELSSWT